MQTLGLILLISALVLVFEFFFGCVTYAASDTWRLRWVGKILIFVALNLVCGMFVLGVCLLSG